MSIITYSLNILSAIAFFTLASLNYKDFMAGYGHIPTWTPNVIFFVMGFLNTIHFISLAIKDEEEDVQ